MQLRPLTWEYIGNSDCLWQGKADGLLSHVSFTITNGTANGDFIIRTDLDGIPQVSCDDLDEAKAAAQDILTGYAFSLIIF